MSKPHDVAQWERIQALEAQLADANRRAAEAHAKQLWVEATESLDEKTARLMANSSRLEAERDAANRRAEASRLGWESAHNHVELLEGELRATRAERDAAQREAAHWKKAAKMDGAPASELEVKLIEARGEAVRHKREAGKYRAALEAIGRAPCIVLLPTSNGDCGDCHTCRARAALAGDGSANAKDSHVITIVLKADGSVQGDLDDEIALSPIGTESTAESTSTDGQARSVLQQALMRILTDDLAGGRITSRTSST